MKMEEDVVVSEIKQLQETIEGDPTAHNLLSLLQTLKALEEQESELQSKCILEHAKLQAKVDELEELLRRGKEGKLSEDLDHTFRDLTEKLDSARRELAAKLRSTVSLKRQLDDVPTQAELIQSSGDNRKKPLVPSKLMEPKLSMEMNINLNDREKLNPLTWLVSMRLLLTTGIIKKSFLIFLRGSCHFLFYVVRYELRFSELFTHIQAKHRQTHKYYATYNTLLEIKELMLKEMSLLNSISSQFKDALTSPVGRKKLIDSMEGILHGTQQKLEKVQSALHSEQKARDALKGKYAAAISEQRHYNSLLKAFQVECAKNERLRVQASLEPLKS